MSDPHSAQLTDGELEQMRRQAIEFAGIGFWRCKPDGTVVFMDERALEILEIQTHYPQPSEVTGRNLAEIMPHAERLSELMEIVCREGAIKNFECRFRLDDGRPKWVLCDAGLHHDPDTHEQTIQAVMRDNTKQARVRNGIDGLNACFLSFGPDPDHNINRLTQFVGEALGGTCALYNRLEKGLLCSSGQWETPPDYDPVDRPDGHICYDVIQQDSDDIFLVRDLPHTAYAKTDQNVKRYGLQTYVGVGVELEGRRVGSLCVVYQSDYTPTREDEQLLRIVSSAIGVEEERKRAKGALVESEEKYRAVVEQSLENIFLLEPEGGRILDANPALQNLLGYTSEEMKELNAFDFVAHAREDVEEKIALIVREKHSHLGERRYRCKGGSIVDVDVSASLINYVGKHVISVVSRDLTEQKQAQEALLKSEEKFRTLAENINVGIYRTTAGPSGRFIESNPAIVAMFGYQSREEFLSRNVIDFYQKPDDRARFSEKILKEGYVRGEELHLKRKDGSSFLASVSTVAVRDDEAGITYFDGIIEDITERKRAEEALRWSELQYRTTLNAMGDAIHVVNRDLTLILFNRSFIEWNKELDLPTAVLGQRIDKVFPFLPKKVFNEYERVFRTGESLVTDEITRIAGKTLATEARKIPVREKDDVVRVVTVIRDVTANKQAEAALRESEERYRGLFDNATDFVFAMDLKGTFINANRATEHHTGLPSEELIGKNFIRYIPRGDRRRAIRAFRHLYKTGKPLQDFPIDVIIADGTRKHFEISTGLLKRGEEIIGFQGSGRDVTERKEAHEALRRSEERFRELAELLPEIVFEMNTDGELTFVNRKAFEMTGYRLEDLEKAFTVVDFLVPEDRERALTNIEKSMNRGESGDNEYTAQRQDGSTFPVMARSVPIVSNGEVVGLRGILVDITERQRLEEQLRHAAKMEAIGQLAGGIAHDFNNLLTGILGYSNMLKLRSEPGSEIHDAAKTIEGAAERAAELTEKLLGFARRGKRRVMPVDMHKTIYDVVSLLSRTISKSIRISVHLAAKTAGTLGDPGQLQQMLLNLAINARDAMPEGGDLTFSTRRVRLDDEYCHIHPESAPGEYLAVEVSDTGCGIPKEIGERIYEPFFTTKPTGQGTGMGLAMVYGIVKNHGGEIEVSSEVGHGTIFRVLLPMVEEPPVTTDEETGQQPMGGVGAILVVDDEEIVRMAVSDMLKRLGYDVTAASSGREAVEYYRKHGSKIDLVIIDMIMPDMDGSDFFEHLRTIDPGVKVLLSTGYGPNGKVQEALDKGARGFIQKPYQLKELDMIVREALADRDGERD